MLEKGDSRWKLTNNQHRGWGRVCLIQPIEILTRDRPMWSDIKGEQWAWSSIESDGRVDFCKGVCVQIHLGEGSEPSLKFDEAKDLCGAPRAMEIPQKLEVGSATVDFRLAASSFSSPAHSLPNQSWLYCSNPSAKHLLRFLCRNNLHSLGKKDKIFFKVFLQFQSSEWPCPTEGCVVRWKDTRKHSYS